MEKLGLRDSHYRLDDVAERESAVAQGCAKLIPSIAQYSSSPWEGP
jgi:hypothetical protein